MFTSNQTTQWSSINATVWAVTGMTIDYINNLAVISVSGWVDMDSYNNLDPAISTVSTQITLDNMGDSITAIEAQVQTALPASLPTFSDIQQVSTLSPVRKINTIQ